MTGRWLIDAGVGETRAGLLEGEQIVELVVRRATDLGRRAELGAVHRARILRVEQRLRGAFLDLGIEGPAAFLRLEAAAVPPVEGTLATVRVVREAGGGKGPVVRRLPDPPVAGPEGPRLEAPGLDALALNAAQRLDPEARARLDEAFEEAGEIEVRLPGGGRIAIEPTAALTAVDVDASDRQGSGDAERFALELNLAAAAAAFRQLRLRSLGGLAAIDFVAMRAPRSRARLNAALAALARADVGQTRAAPLSEFGLAEIMRRQTRQPLHERMAGPARVEAAAWAALRAIEREAAHARGRRVVAGVCPEVDRFLRAVAFDWRAALSNRIGTLWTVAPRPGAGPGKVEIALQEDAR
jgi:Ribonuclease G/E